VGAEPNTIIINEIMYDPIESDTNHEWIELYNPTNHTINLTNWTIQDNTATDTIQPYDNHSTMLLQPKSYALLTDKDTEIYNNHTLTNETLRLTVDDNSIGNGLGNTQDCLILTDHNGTIIDTIKWGTNDTTIPGPTLDPVPEGTTLARINTTQHPFTIGAPTPGETNTVYNPGTLTISLFPTYVPKIYKDDTYGFPIPIYIEMQNYTPQTTYELKAYITNNESNTYPATQTWDTTTWQYSDRYCITLATDEQGSYSTWVYLRFNKEYLSYQETIQHNNTAIIQIKIRQNNLIDHTTAPIHLLDMDTSTTQATPGGYLVNISQFHNHTLTLTDENGSIVGITQTEPNNIQENQCNIPGYYRLTAPVGTNYTLNSYTAEETLCSTKTNVSITQGRYDLFLTSQQYNLKFSPGETINLPLTITNTGSFTDTIYIDVETTMRTWKNSLNTSTITLPSNTSAPISLNILSPDFPESNTNTQTLTITATSQHDPSETQTITASCVMHAPDLTIRKIICYNQDKQETNTIHEGETIRIKAYLKNQGDEPAESVHVHYYIDQVDPAYLIGTKHYDSVEQYQKYPSIEWDTHHYLPGTHTIYVIVDEENTIKEKDEYNNLLYTTITLQNTTPSIQAQQIIFSEIYYHTHSGIYNEYMVLTNPTNETIDITDWYLTTTPNRSNSEQRKIIFSQNTILCPNQSVYITQNASAFQYETGFLPNYEYAEDSHVDIPNLQTTVTQYLSNTGCAVALKDAFNHTIDLVLYGNISETFEGWNNDPIPSVSCGEILLRSTNNTTYMDTNTAADWIQPRYYTIGQSRATLQTFSGAVNLTCFVSPDCSYEAITNELAHAQHSIDINMYEFTHPFLCKALTNALKRGVEVRLFLEGSPVGGISEEECFLLNRLHTYGADIRFIVSDQEKDIYARYPFDHGKYLIIDNKTVIVESCNWAKTGVPVDPSFGNREWGIIIRNATIAATYRTIYEDDWNPDRCDSISYEHLNLSRPDLYQITDDTYYGRYNPTLTPLHTNTFCTMTPIFSPDTSLTAILDLLKNAQKTIYIEQLYIYRYWGNTSSPLVEALVNKAEQGLDIRIILNYNPWYQQTKMTPSTIFHHTTYPLNIIIRTGPYSQIYITKA